MVASNDSWQLPVQSRSKPGSLVASGGGFGVAARLGKKIGDSNLHRSMEYLKLFIGSWCRETSDGVNTF